MDFQRNTLKKTERLYLRNEIKQLFLSRKGFSNYPFKIIYQVVEKESNSPVQILISVPKRLFKHAVDRNLIKRRTREAFRKNKHILYEYLQKNNLKLNISFIYISKEIEDYSTIENKIVLTLQRLIQKNEENN
jgi:ribonuclease P protein component